MTLPAPGTASGDADQPLRDVVVGNIAQASRDAQPIPPNQPEGTVFLRFSDATLRQQFWAKANTTALVTILGTLNGNRSGAPLVDVAVAYYHRRSGGQTAYESYLGSQAAVAAPTSVPTALQGNYGAVIPGTPLSSVVPSDPLRPSQVSNQDRVLAAIADLTGTGVALSGYLHTLQSSGVSVDDWRNAAAWLQQQMAAANEPLSVLETYGMEEHNTLNLRCTAAAGIILGDLNVALAADMIQAILPNSTAASRTEYIQTSAASNGMLNDWEMFLASSLRAGSTGSLPTVHLTPELVYRVMTTVPATKSASIPMGCQ